MSTWNSIDDSDCWIGSRIVSSNHQLQIVKIVLSSFMIEDEMQELEGVNMRIFFLFNDHTCPPNCVSLPFEPRMVDLRFELILQSVITCVFLVFILKTNLAIHHLNIVSLSSIHLIEVCNQWFHF